MSDERDLEAQARARIGTVIRGKYHVDEILGMGGMAVVYRATHRNKAEFALKMLHPELCARASVRKRFLREGYAANSVKHPGAVKVVDDDVAEDGAAFLVMELLEGASVDHLLDDGARPPLAVVAGIGLQALEVLAAAHAAAVVHRDIKPANLFLTREGTVKVLDFGIARALDDSGGGTQVTGAGMPIGTPAFMAPEQALARSADIDARTDVWAVGATLFTLLTGDTVHPGSVTAQVLVAAATTPARSLASVAPGVPAPIAAVVDRALAFDRTARWKDAGEMQGALAAACAEAGVAAADRQALGAVFPAGRVGHRSVGPTAFASTAVSSPSTAGEAGARPGTAPAVSSTGRPGPSEAPRRARRARAASLGASVLAVAVVSSGVALWRHRSGAARALSSATPSATATTPPTRSTCRVLVLGFDNRAGDPLLDGTVEQVFAAAVNRSSRVDAPPPNLLRALAAEVDAGKQGVDEHVAQQIQARHGGVVVTVRGVVAQEGTGYSVSITARDAKTGAVVLSTTRDAADASGLVPALGRLACDVRAALGDSPPTDPRLAEQTGMSTSVEADHEAVIAISLVNAGKYGEGVVYLRRAVSLDPGFGLGHWMLANALSATGERAEARREYELGMQNAEGLTELKRAELRADYFNAIGAYDRAVAPLEDALREAPGDLHVQTLLTGQYIETNQTGRALDVARRTAADHPDAVLAWSNLAEVELRAGNLDRAVEAADKVLRDFPHAPVDAYVCLAVAEALRGQATEAADTYRKLSAQDASRAAHGLADLAMAQGRLADADSILRGAIDADVAAKDAQGAASKRVLLAEELLRKGDSAGAVAAARKAAESDDPATRYAAGSVAIAAGYAKDALRLASALGESPAQDARMYAKILEAQALRAAGKARESLAKLADANDISDSWLGHLELARAYLDAKDYARAETELKVCGERRGEGALAFSTGAPSVRVLMLLEDAKGRLSR